MDNIIFSRIIFGPGEFSVNVPKYKFGYGDGWTNIRSLRGCSYWYSKQNERVFLKEIPDVGHRTILNNQSVIDYIEHIFKNFK